MAMSTANRAGLAATKRRMNQRGLGVADVAGSINYSEGHISDVLRGKKNASNELMVRLAELFGFDPRLWMQDHEGPTRAADIPLVRRRYAGPGRGHIGEPARKLATPHQAGDTGQPSRLARKSASASTQAEMAKAQGRQTTQTLHRKSRRSQKRPST